MALERDAMRLVHEVNMEALSHSDVRSQVDVRTGEREPMRQFRRSNPIRIAGACR